MLKSTAVCLIVLNIFCLTSSLPAAGIRHRIPTVYSPRFQTVYKTGDDSGDLQVHVRGPQHNMLEIFFHENLERYAIPNGIDLCRNGRVLVPAKNDLGTLAVQYGTTGFTAFGWKGNAIIPLTVGRNTYPPTGSDPDPHVVDIDLDPACPICLEWVSPRILRITHGPRLGLEYVVRFDGDSKPWKVLYSGPVAP